MHAYPGAVAQDIGHSDQDLCEASTLQAPIGHCSPLTNESKPSVMTL